MIVSFGIIKIDWGVEKIPRPLKEEVMEKKIEIAIENHKIWIDSLGENGRKISLDEVTIEDEKWSDINLSQGNITGCTFRNITLEYVDFYATMLCSSSFTNARVMSGEFVKANMMYIQFLDSKLEDINLSKADLSNAIFKNTEIVNGKFINALLDGMCFEKVSFNNVNFAGAWIENVIFSKDTVIKEIHGLNEAHIKSINIGTERYPVYLKEKEAVQWLKNE